MQKSVTWTQMKNILNNKTDLSVQAFLQDNHWFLSVVDGALTLTLTLSTEDTNEASYVADFIANYLPSANNQIDTKKLKGGTDGAIIGNVGDSLKTKSELTPGGVGDNPADTPGCPTLSTKTRVDWSNTKIDLPNSGQLYADIYVYNGSGKFLGFEMEFNSDNVEVRLEIDGEEIFAIDCDFLEDFTAKGDDDDDFVSGLKFLGWNHKKNMIIFDPDCPIAYNYNITIQARANSSSNKRDMQRFKVHLTKET